MSIQGFGWAIAKQLAEAGAEISLGVWVSTCCDEMLWYSLGTGHSCILACKCCVCAPQVPALSIFETSLRRGKFDANRKLENGGMLEFANIYPMDAVYDTPEDVPEDVSLGHILQHNGLPASLWVPMLHADCSKVLHPRSMVVSPCGESEALHCRLLTTKGMQQHQARGSQWWRWPSRWRGTAARLTSWCTVSPTVLKLQSPCWKPHAG